MTTKAWRGFIRSWHKLGVVLKRMCYTGIGIPAAIATCILVACAVVLFAILCLLAAAFACAIVFYICKGSYIGLRAFGRYINKHRYRSTTLPTSSQQNKVSWTTTPSIAIPLQARGTEIQNQRKATEPLGYVYPWYEGSLQPPHQAHLVLHEEDPSPLPATSNIPTTRDPKFPPPASLNASILPASFRGTSGGSDPSQAKKFIPYCRICRRAKPRIQFPSHNITSRCSHHPEICLACLSESIARDFGGSTWEWICCPLCNQQLEYQDVREFGAREIFER
jgi:hypothetical protein